MTKETGGLVADLAMLAADPADVPELLGMKRNLERDRAALKSDG